MDQLFIFDTTLRDGEQSPGASMTREEKLRIATQLEKLGVDIIEAGYPASSPEDFESVKQIAALVRESTICGLSRCIEKDIRATGEAIKPAARGRIHVFIATSPIHMEKKLRMSPEQVMQYMVDAIRIAKQYTDDIEFSAEDACRSDTDFLCRVFESAIKEGATTINVPDTVGYTMPWQMGQLIEELIRRVPNSDKAIWSAHCHNDLGVAVANSLAAVRSGARQVECTINGLGERAGNAALEEIVMAVHTRKDLFPCQTRINTTHLLAASKLVSSITGFPVQPNKAIVGINAFAHESGIHQDGVIKHRETYEIMRAEHVGWNANQLVLGKHSGRNAFKKRLTELGIVLHSEESINDAFARFKELADKKHTVFDEDLHALCSDELAQPSDHYHLLNMSYQSEDGLSPKVNLSLMIDGKTINATAESGNGPVDATFKAIESVATSNTALSLYSVNAITEGSDAQGEVTVRLERDGRIVNGQGADTDIVIASAKAYLNALNRLHSIPYKLSAQEAV